MATYGSSMRIPSTASPAAATSETTRAARCPPPPVACSRTDAITLPPSRGRMGRRLNTPQAMVTKMRSVRALSSSSEPGPTDRATQMASPPAAKPVNGPARLTTIDRRGGWAVPVVKPPNPWRVISADEPKRRKARAWPSSWTRMPKPATRIHSTTNSPSRPPAKPNRPMITKKRGSTRTGKPRTRNCITGPG